MSVGWDKFAAVIFVLISIIFAQQPYYNPGNYREHAADIFGGLRKNAIEEKFKFADLADGDLYKMLREQQIAKPVKPPLSLRIPEGLHDDAIAPAPSAYSRTCAVNSDFKFLLEPDQPMPNFFIVGLSPVAASRFSNMLAKHPQIRAPQRIDTGFFSFPGISKTTAEAYQEYFRNHGHDDSIMGDFSSTYFQHPLVPRRIATSIPNAKIIIFLRNPVSRAYGSYLTLASKNVESSSFEETIQMEFKEVLNIRESARNCAATVTCDVSNCLPQDPVFRKGTGQPWSLKSEREWREYILTSVLYSNIYDDLVERWYQAFPAENIFIQFYESSQQSRQSGLDQITDFLGVERFSFFGQKTLEFSDAEQQQVANAETALEMRSLPISEETYNILQEFFQPFNERLFQIIGRREDSWSKPWATSVK